LDSDRLLFYAAFMPPLTSLKRALRLVAKKDKSSDPARFFKTGKGEYGEGDIFLGVPVPEQRIIAKEYEDLPLADTKCLLESAIHEERFTALLILVDQYKKGDEKTKKKIFRFYITHTKRINNWDLVDVSARDIVGEYLVSHERVLLYKLARSKNIWERRISIVATWAFIKRGDYGDTLAIAKLLFADTQDLIHKATGWMLREVGKKDASVFRRFLDKHTAVMPRTTLRYAIERLTPGVRKAYLLR
jgi:3-methyladenine DNA glycosylase AlkD